MDLSIHCLQNRWRHSITVRVFRMTPTQIKTKKKQLLRYMFQYLCNRFTCSYDKKIYPWDNIWRLLTLIPRQMGHCVSFQRSGRWISTYLHQKRNRQNSQQCLREIHYHILYRTFSSYCQEQRSWSWTCTVLANRWISSPP